MLQSLGYLLCRVLLGVILGRNRSQARVLLENTVLRHQLRILKRQNPKPRITGLDRAFLTAAARRAKEASRNIVIVKPRTVLRWHKKLVAFKWRRYTRRRNRRGRPPLPEETQRLILRLARENPRWGRHRIHGELINLGVEVSPTSIRRLMRREGLGPVPTDDMTSWTKFLTAQASSILACDFFTVETVFHKRLWVLFFIDLATRKVRMTTSTKRPNGAWVTQQARHLLAGDDWAEHKFLIRDRDSKFTASFDEVFASEGIEVRKTPYRSPRANAHAERFVKTVRNECLDHLLIVGRRHLDQVLRIYANHYNTHRPHRSLDQRAPAATKAERPSGTPARILRRDLLGGLIHEYHAEAA